MERDEVVRLMRQIETSIEMRRHLHDKLNRNEEVDLVDEWHGIEQVDVEIANFIRKRPIE